MAGCGGDFEAALTARMTGRLFTVTQANRSLVLVRRIVNDITQQYTLLGDLQETIEAAQESGRYDQVSVSRNDLLRSVERIQDYVSELDDIGVDLEDWTLGVVHFPCLAGGREVVLCWQQGEDEVGFWHEVDSQFADRKSIDTLPAEQTAAQRL